MSFDVNVYDPAVFDLCAGNFNASTTINALLLTPSYTFDRTQDQVSDVTSRELSGSGYSRYTGASTFTVAQINDEVQFQVLTPTVTFSPFSGNWRYIVLYNSSTNALYLCVDTQVTNTQTSSSFVLDPGTDPFIRVVAP